MIYYKIYQDNKQVGSAITFNSGHCVVEDDEFDLPLCYECEDDAKYHFSTLLGIHSSIVFNIECSDKPFVLAGWKRAFEDDNKGERLQKVKAPNYIESAVEKKDWELGYKKYWMR